MSKLQEKRDELIKLRGQWKTLWESKPDRDFTDEEATNLKTWNEAMAPIQDEVTRLEALEKQAEENQREHERLTKGLGIQHPNGERKESREREPAFKTVGQLIEESQAFKDLAQRGYGTASIEINPTQYKTLLTLGDLNAPAERLTGIREMALETRTVRDLFAQGTTGANTIEYYEETTLTNAAAAVAEGGTKPESALDYTLRTENVRKIATWIPVTREMLQDVPQIRSIVENRLRFMVEREIEDQIINGDGTAPNLSGILDRVGLQTTAAAAPADVLDELLDAITLIRVNAFAEPDGIIMHPNDYADMAKLRTADGIYILGNPQNDPNIRAWGLPIRITTAQTQNTAIVGAFGSMAQIFQREGIVVTASTEHSTFFVENKVAILAETRLALAVYRPNAFCTVTGI